MKRSTITFPLPAERHECNEGPGTPGPFVHNKRPGEAPGPTLIDNLAQLPLLVLPPEPIGDWVVDPQHCFLGRELIEQPELEHFVDCFRASLLLLGLVQFLEGWTRQYLRASCTSHKAPHVRQPRRVVDGNGEEQGKP